jgi:hypothetical protein
MFPRGHPLHVDCCCCCGPGVAAVPLDPDPLTPDESGLPYFRCLQLAFDYGFRLRFARMLCRARRSPGPPNYSATSTCGDFFRWLKGPLPGGGAVFRALTANPESASGNYIARENAGLLSASAFCVRPG